MRPLRAEGLRERVHLVEYSSDDDEDAQAEDHDNRSLFVPGDPELQKHWEGDSEHEDVGRDVEDGVGDEVVGSGIALWVGGRNGPGEKV